MAVEITKQEKEATASVLKRFAKKVKESGILKKARAYQFRTRPISKRIKKEQALKKIKREQKIEYLKKIGKIK